jgi:hypothetical protein
MKINLKNITYPILIVLYFIFSLYPTFIIWSGFYDIISDRTGIGGSTITELLVTLLFLAFWSVVTYLFLKILIKSSISTYKQSTVIIFSFLLFALFFIIWSLFYKLAF